jgi:nicotinate-nucleotide pyrophosphorylase
MAPQAKIVVRAEKVADARAMYAAGADYVLLPRHLVAEEARRVVALIEEGRLEEARAAELQALDARREVVA